MDGRQPLQAQVHVQWSQAHVVSVCTCGQLSQKSVWLGVHPWMNQLCLGCSHIPESCSSGAHPEPGRTSASSQRGWSDSPSAMHKKKPSLWRLKMIGFYCQRNMGFTPAHVPMEEATGPWNRMTNVGQDHPTPYRMLSTLTHLVNAKGTPPPSLWLWNFVLNAFSEHSTACYWKELNFSPNFLKQQDMVPKPQNKVQNTASYLA